jgi:hypothetical protein
VPTESKPSSQMARRGSCERGRPKRPQSRTSGRFKRSPNASALLSTLAKRIGAADIGAGGRDHFVTAAHRNARHGSRPAKPEPVETIVTAKRPWKRH